MYDWEEFREYLDSTEEMQEEAKRKDLLERLKLELYRQLKFEHIDWECFRGYVNLAEKLENME